MCVCYIENTLNVFVILHYVVSPVCGVGSRAVSLKTEDRAARHAEWVKWKKEKEMRVAEKKQERECQEREAEEAEMRRLRQQTIHRARPVPRFLRQRNKCDESAAE